MAVLLSKEFSEDGCVWYLINIVLDTTIGTALCYSILYLVNRCAEKCGCPGLVSGNYYHKRTYQINCGYWLLQLLIWCGIVSIVSSFSPQEQNAFLPRSRNSTWIFREGGTLGDRTCPYGSLNSSHNGDDHCASHSELFTGE